MGKAKYFYALSGILLLAGWASILFGSGIRYGIDFKGGTNVDVRFRPGNLPMSISSAMASRPRGWGVRNPEHQRIAIPIPTKWLVFVEGKGQDDAALQASREKSADRAERYLWGSRDRASLISMSRHPPWLAAVLTEKDPLLLSVNAGDRYQQLAKKLLDYRDKNYNGVDQLI